MLQDFMLFTDYDLQEPILKALEAIGFEKATPIQQKTIPLLTTQKTDIIGLAQTGTGKTAAFSLPLLSNIDFNEDITQALIICPTRELCLQISKDIEQFSKFIPNTPPKFTLLFFCC